MSPSVRDTDNGVGRLAERVFRAAVGPVDADEAEQVARECLAYRADGAELERLELLQDIARKVEIRRSLCPAELALLAHFV